jgi:hypothetical protein
MILTPAHVFELIAGGQTNEQRNMPSGIQAGLLALISHDFRYVSEETTNRASIRFGDLSIS